MLTQVELNRYIGALQFRILEHQKHEEELVRLLLTEMPDKAAVVRDQVFDGEFPKHLQHLISMGLGAVAEDKSKKG